MENGQKDMFSLISTAIEIWGEDWVQWGHSLVRFTGYLWKKSKEKLTSYMKVQVSSDHHIVGLISRKVYYYSTGQTKC